MFDATRTEASEAGTGTAVKADTATVSPTMHRIVRLQYAILALVALKFGLLLLGAVASRGWLG